MSSSSGIQNYSESQDPTSSVRRTIKKELEGKVLYDQQIVFDTLFTDKVNDQFVDSCLSAFKQSDEMQDAVRSLKALEGERKKGTRHTGQRKRERDMYPHLDHIFKFITTFDRASATMTQNARKFHISLSPIADGGHTFGFPKGQPDFIIANAEAGYSIWRDVSAFVEVKATKKQGPKPIRARDGTIQEIVVQAADYARLFLSARPFMLFAVALLISGSEFCVGIFDRGGVRLSPVLDMWEKLVTFIKVIRSLSCDLTEVELGLDPTVFEVDHQTATDLGVDTSYPTYLVGPVGDDAEQRTWCTIDVPRWSSLSFTGRGTMVWKVREYIKGRDNNKNRLNGPEMILKNFWRSSKRDSESTIYQSVQGEHPGLAKFLTGGDVRDPRPVLRQKTVTNPPDHVAKGILDEIISVRHLRGDALDASAPTPVLHRLLLSTVGRPLWQYSSDVELLKGMRAALEGHRFLCEQGILHRDISAGNILLAAGSSAPPGCEGFITDLEFAWTETVIGPSNLSPETALSVPAQRGAAITGTLQFMAMHLLNCLKRKQKDAVHTVEHDLESFIWSMVYAILRKLLTVQDAPSHEKTLLTTMFQDSFGRLTIDRILKSRRDLTPFDFLSDDVLNEGTLLRRNMSRGLFDFVLQVGTSTMRRRSDMLKYGKLNPTRFHNLDPLNVRDGPLSHVWINATLTEVIEVIEAGSQNWDPVV